MSVFKLSFFLSKLVRYQVIILKLVTLESMYAIFLFIYLCPEFNWTPEIPTGVLYSAEVESVNTEVKYHVSVGPNILKNGLPWWFL